jgi:transposase
MIALSPGGRVYLACGVTDMRKGAVGLAMLVQQSLAENPFDGSVYAFRGRRSGLIKLIWHDGIGLCMLTKRLEQGQFHWPSVSTTGRIALSSTGASGAPPHRAAAPSWRGRKCADPGRNAGADATASSTIAVCRSTSTGCLTTQPCCSRYCGMW